MNPLVFLPLLAAAASAGVLAPTLLSAQPHATLVSAPQVHTVQVPQVHTVQVPQVHTVQVQQVHNIQVPVTKTIHYANQNVVTGYSTQVIKPSLSAVHLAGLNTIDISRQVPEIPQPPAAPPADFPAPSLPNNSTTPPPLGDSPIGDSPTLPPLQPPTQAPPNENGTGSDQAQIPIPGSPITLLNYNANVHQFVNPIPISLAPAVALAPQVAVAKQAVAVAPAVAVAKQAVVAPAVAVRAAQAGDFEPLVTKEKVLAPVRTHTQITPQLTKIQPEITVRKVIQEVPVATPVAYQTPVIQKIAAPIAYQTVQHVASPVAIQGLQKVVSVHGLQQVASLPAATSVVGDAKIIQAA